MVSFARNPKPHFVYELWDRNGCLYVGVTCSIGQRLANHASTKPWWREVDRVVADMVGMKGAALDEEARRIDEHQPRHNHYGKVYV